VSGTSLNQVEKYKLKHLGMVFASDEGRRQNEELNTRMGKASAVMMRALQYWTAIKTRIVEAKLSVFKTVFAPCSVVMSLIERIYRK